MPILREIVEILFEKGYINNINASITKESLLKLMNDVSLYEEINKNDIIPLLIIMKFNADDYVNITSFSHHPFYSPFILEVPDNFSNGAYFNIPLNDMIDVVKNAVNSGYTVLWDADVSNNGFNAKKGMALNIKADENVNTAFANPDFKEEAYTQNTRQQLFENLTTQDDHLMHIVGIEKSKEGKTFFIVKNSWGETGPVGGYVHVSEAYFAVNTISLVVPKAAVGVGLRERLNVK